MSIPANLKPKFHTTKVPESQTRLEIEHVLFKAGADKVATRTEQAGIGFLFERGGVAYRVSLDMPEESQERRRRMRVLLYIITAKIITVDEGVSTFEEAFVESVVTASGQTVTEMVMPMIEAGIKNGTHVKALPPMFGGQK